MKITKNKNMSNFNLQTENLVIDYITLNYKLAKPKFENKTLIKFFHSYKFNCYWVDAKTDTKILQTCDGFVKNSYEYQVTFVINFNQCNSKLILIQFSGQNAGYFYQILKTGHFRWDFFSSGKVVVSRLDLNYLQSTVGFDKDLLNKLIEALYAESVIKFKQRYPRAETQIYESTLCLGTRTGDYFLRVYRIIATNSLKYELEIKKYKARLLTNLIIYNEFEQLEQQIIENFYHYLKIALHLDTPLTNWLCFRLRKSDKQRDSIVSNYLPTKYIPTSVAEQKFFYELLQFLSFTRALNYKVEKLNGIDFYSYVFSLSDFAKWIKKYPLSTYQRKKLLIFFNRLIELPTDYGWFCNANKVNKIFYISPFPILVYKQENNKPIEIRISISKIFYEYQYPYYLPTSFITYKNRNDFRIKYIIIEAMIIGFSPVKTIYLKHLFSNKTSNKNKTILKTSLINGLKYLNKNNLIEQEIQLKQANKKQKIQINKLTSKALNSWDIIIFYEKIQ